jgi:hypothetical protein
MIRRNQRTGALPFYRCSTPRPCRWPCWAESSTALNIEERFQTSKGPVAFDQHQVRARTCRYQRQASWHW